MKKLIRDTCLKTPFLSNGKLYQQIDGVSMGSSLGPVMANIIMTELEKSMINNLFNLGISKFYIRYVDDTLVLAKPDDFQLLTANSITVYRKDTHTTLLHSITFIVLDNSHQR